MSRSILALPVWLIGALFLIVLPAIVLLVQWGIRRRWPALSRGEHNDVIGFIIAVVGVIYAVLLGFVVIAAWENFDEAEQVVGLEASALRSIYRESIALPPETRAPLQDLVREYATESRPVNGRQWHEPDQVTRGWATSSTRWLVRSPGHRSRRLLSRNSSAQRWTG